MKLHHYLLVIIISASLGYSGGISAFYIKQDKVKRYYTLQPQMPFTYAPNQAGIFLFGEDGKVYWNKLEIQSNPFVIPPISVLPEKVENKEK